MKYGVLTSVSVIVATSPATNFLTTNYTRMFSTPYYRRMINRVIHGLLFNIHHTLNEYIIRFPHYLLQIYDISKLPCLRFSAQSVSYTIVELFF